MKLSPVSFGAQRLRALLIIGALVMLTIAAFAAALPAMAITPPTDPDPEPLGSVAITSTVPEVISSSPFTVSGTAAPGNEITVEANGAGGATCMATADASGIWECAVALADESVLLLQAYRNGGAYLQDYDDRTAYVVFPPSFDSPGDIWWNASSLQTITGTRADFAELELSVDGDPGVCPTQAGSPAGIWQCTIFTPIAEGTYALSAVQRVFLGGAWRESAPAERLLAVDLTAPTMATVTVPMSAPALPPMTLGSINYASPLLQYEGTGEPGADITVYTVADLVNDGDFEALRQVACSTTVNSNGDWSCNAWGQWFSVGQVVSVGTQQTDLAGNVSVLQPQFRVNIVDNLQDPVVVSHTSGQSVTDTTPTLVGTGFSPETIAVEWQGSWVCDAEVINGMWECELPELPLGTHTFTLYSVNWFMESQSAGVDFQLTVVSPPAPPAQPVTPTTTTVQRPSTSTPSPLAWTYELRTPQGTPLGQDLIPGDTFVVVASSLPPGSTVSVVLDPQGLVLGTGVVGSDGSLTLEVTVPESTEPGDYTLSATLTPPNGVPSPVTRTLSVGVASSSVEPEPSPTVAHEPSAGGEVEETTAEITSVNSTDGIDLGQPSTIGTALQSFSEVTLTPVTAAITASVAVAFILLVALPAELMQSTLAANYSRAFAWLTPVRRKTARVAESIPARFKTGKLGGAITVAFTALLLGFADPGFGFNWTSVRLFAAIFASLYIVNVAVLGVLRIVARNRYEVPSRIDPMPASLLIVALSVLVSRLAGIEPGFLFGLVVGVVFARELSKIEEGKLALLGVVLMIALGLTAWGVYSVLPSGEDGGFVVNLARDIAAATTLESLGTILVALLPVAFLDGKALFAWNRALWSIAYGAALTVFILVVVPMSDTWGEMRAPFVGWMSLFVGFAVVALAVWLGFRFIPEKNADAVPVGSGTMREE